MNRRKLLSLIGATALTPVIPAQVFAAGGIVNPSSACLNGERGPEYLVPRGRMIGIAMNSGPKGGMVSVWINPR